MLPVDSSLFKLSVVDAFKKYKDLQRSLSEDCPVSLTFSYEKQVTPGVVGSVTDLYPDGSKVRLMSNTLFDAEHKLGARLLSGFAQLDGETVVGHVVTYDHEVAHAVQHGYQHGLVDRPYFTEDQFGSGYDSIGNAYFSLLRVCSKANPFWAKGNRSEKTQVNYFHDPSEIMAVKASYINGCKHLREMFPNVSEDQCRLAVLHQLEQECFEFQKDENGNMKRVGKRPYYIDFDMDCDLMGMTMEDLGKKFDEACLAAWNRQAKYDLSYSIQGLDCQKDGFCQTIALTGSCDTRDREPSPWDTVYDEFVKDGIDLRRSIEVMGSIVLMNHRGLEKAYPPLQILCGRLDPDVMFGEDFRAKVRAYDEARGRKPLYMKAQQDRLCRFRSDRVRELESRVSGVLSFIGYGPDGKTGPGE